MIIILTQCFPPDKGGIENLMGSLADALVVSGESVAVLADHVRGGGQAPSFAYPVTRFGGVRPARRWLKMRALRQRMRQGDVRAIIADSWKSVTHLPPLDIPVLVLAHGMEYPRDATDAKRQRIREALVRATHVIANSRYTASLTEPYIAKEKVCVIHPPIYPQPMPEQEVVSALASKIGDARPLIVTVSRLEPRKGIDQVIRAMPAILSTYPAARYIVGGEEGSDHARLEALVRQCGVAHAVRFLGVIEDHEKAALLARADVFAMPTRREGNSVEGFGISYIEAAWYGVPAIAGRDGGAVDAVLDEQTGLTCAGDDSAAVQQCLLRLLADEGLRQRLGAAAKARVQDELQWPSAIEKYKALMQR